MQIVGPESIPVLKNDFCCAVSDNGKSSWKILFITSASKLQNYRKVWYLLDCLNVKIIFLHGIFKINQYLQ